MGDAVGLVFFGTDGSLYAVMGPPGNAGLPVQFAGGAGVGNVNLTQVASNAVVTGGVAGLLGVGGSSAAGAADDGSNPLKIGGVYLSVWPTLTTGERGAANLTPNSNLTMSIGAPSGTAPAFVAVGVPSDGFGAGDVRLSVAAIPELFSSAGQLNKQKDITGAVSNGAGSAAVTVAPTSAAPAGIAPNATAALASSLIAKAAPGNLYGFNVVSTTPAGYVMIFDSATVPADGAVTPKKCYPLAANTGIELDYNVPLKMANGIVLVFSSTGPYNKTASATAFIEADAV